MVAHKCSNCFWGQERQKIPKHFGCYAYGRWQRWVPKHLVDVPNDCKAWKPARTS